MADDDSPKSGDLISEQADEGREGDPRPRQFELDLVEKGLELERERIDVTRQRNEVMRSFVEAQDAADRRQFEYHTQKLQLDADNRRDRHSFIAKFAWTSLAGLGGVLALVLGMAFFGSAAQSALAVKFLEVLFTGVGGAGILVLLRGVLSRLTKPPR